MTASSITLMYQDPRKIYPTEEKNVVYLQFEFKQTQHENHQK